jgi:hypothetical protein
MQNGRTCEPGRPFLIQSTRLAITATSIATGLLATGLTRSLAPTSGVLVLIFHVALGSALRPLSALLAALLSPLVAALLAALASLVTLATTLATLATLATATLTGLLAAPPTFLTSALAELVVAAVLAAATLAAALILVVRHLLLLLKLGKQPTFVG